MNGEDDDAIRRALGDIDPARSAITKAYRGWQAETLPVRDLNDGPLDRLVRDQIGGFTRLCMTNVDRETRQEFVDQVLIELADVPASLLEPALAEARRKITFPARLIPFIFEFIQDRLDKLQVEGERLKRLAELAG